MPTLCHTLDEAIDTYDSISSSQNSLVLENPFFLATRPVCDSSLVGVSSKISKVSIHMFSIFTFNGITR